MPKRIRRTSEQPAKAKTDTIPLPTDPKWKKKSIEIEVSQHAQFLKFVERLGTLQRTAVYQAFAQWIKEQESVLGPEDK